MKCLFVLVLIAFMSCKNDPKAKNQVIPETTPTETIPIDTQKSGNAEPPPNPVVYNDQLTPLSISNSLDRANVNDELKIYVQVKNTGNDLCTMCNVAIRYTLKDIIGTTAFDSEITNGSFAINNLMPGQVGTIEIKFPVTRIGNYTFYLTDLFGVFKGTNSVKHFDVPRDAKTYLTVLQ